MRQNLNLKRTEKLVLSGIFIALGLIIPYFTGHAVGVAGTILLPMHIPVLIAGLLLGPGFGAMCGLITPILSSLLTAMPALWPTLPMMACELIGYGAVAGLLRRKLKMPLYVSLIAAMVAGRLVKGVAFAVIMLPAGIHPVIESVTGTVVTGLPGIVIQLAFIPAIVKLLEKGLGLQMEKKATDNKTQEMTAIVREAREEILSGGCSCILIKADQIIHRGAGRGVSPLLELMADEEGRQKLKGAIVVDKIIGKAAAMILILGEAAGVYALTMSANGKEYVQKHQLNHNYDRCVDVISNREKNGICPIERSVIDIDDPQAGYEKIKQTRKQLMENIS